MKVALIATTTTFALAAFRIDLPPKFLVLCGNDYRAIRYIRAMTDLQQLPYTAKQ